MLTDDLHNLVIFLPNQYQTRDPDDEKSIGEDFVKWWHLHKPRHHPKYKVNIKENIPQPFAVVKLAHYLASRGRLNLLCR